MGIILNLTARLLGLIFTVLGFILTIMVFILNKKPFFKQYDEWRTQSAIAFDVYKGVVLQHVFNKWFIKPDGYVLKNGIHTISSWIGYNKMLGKNEKLNVLLDKVLHFLEKNHSEKAVLNDRKKFIETAKQYDELHEKLSKIP